MIPDDYTTAEQIEDRARKIAQEEYKRLYSLKHDPAVVRMVMNIAERVADETVSTLAAQEPTEDVPPNTHTRNMPCSLIPAGDDPDTVLLRRAAASERADERHWPADLLTQAADSIDRLRHQHQGQADHITALRTEVDRLTRVKHDVRGQG